MSKRNCPNCGAPYDIDLSRCPYCGTAYFDLSVIDIDACEPFFMKIKTNGMMITQLVRPIAASLEHHLEQTYGTDHCGRRLCAATTNSDLTTNIELHAQLFISQLAEGKKVLFLAESASSDHQRGVE